jgi:hypothetical protein
MMEKVMRLITAGRSAIRMLDRHPRTTDPYEVELYEKLRHQKSRRLRRAVAAVIDELDINVFNDLMKVLKKLRTRENGKGKELDRLELTLELLGYAIDKKKGTSPDFLLWNFNEIYRRLEPVMQAEKARAAG